MPPRGPIPVVLVAALALTCCSDDDEGPCGGKDPPAACTDVAGEWNGTWTVVGGNYDGFSGSYDMSVDANDCRVTGSLSISGETATLQGQLCDATHAALALGGEIGRGSARAEFEGDAMTGSFQITITRPAQSLFDPEPGTYGGTFEGSR